MTILDALTPSNLAEVYDVVTLSRAIDYVHDGRLSDPVVAKLTHDTVVASAVVSGTLPSRYITRLYAELAGDDLWVTSTCTCPVHVDCKHGAALARPHRDVDVVKRCERAEVTRNAAQFERVARAAQISTSRWP